MSTYYTLIESPLQELLLVSNGSALIGLYMLKQRYAPTIREDWSNACDVEPFDIARQQLAAYFRKELQEFCIPLDLKGTIFQIEVWQTLQSVSYGTTITYSDLARRIGRPKSVRAVGQANAHNPISIIIPCHRVISSKGKLTGYGGGLERKAALLALEGIMLFADPQIKSTS